MRWYGSLVTKLCLTLATYGLQPTHGLSWDFLGKNIGVGCYFLLQGISPTQRLKLLSPGLQVDSLPMSHQGSKEMEESLTRDNSEHLVLPASQIHSCHSNQTDLLKPLIESHCSLSAHPRTVPHTQKFLSNNLLGD